MKFIKEVEEEKINAEVKEEEKPIRKESAAINNHTEKKNNLSLKESDNLEEIF